MIITLVELKLYIDTTKSDPVLQKYIDTIEPLVIEYINDKFLDSEVYNNSTSTSFGSDKIIDLNATFVTDGFRAKDLIYVSGSLSNNEFKRIVSLTETAITCDTESAIVTEAVGEDVFVTRSNMPEPIKLGIAEWINLFTTPAANVKSQKIGKFSETYKENSGGVPDSVKILLRTYKQPKYS